MADERQPQDAPSGAPPYRSNAHLETLLTGIRDALLAVDSNWRVTCANPQAADMAGIDRAQVVGRLLWELHPEFVGTSLQAELQRVMSDRRPGASDFFHPPSARWFESRIYPSENGIVIFSMDVTDRKRAEAALAQSEEKFRTLAENAEASIAIIQGMHFVYVNPFTERLTGYTRPDLLELEIGRFIHPDDREEALGRVRRRQAGERIPPGAYELRIVTRDGRERWLSLSVARFEYRGQPAIIGIGYDVTERKRAEQALRRGEQQLRELVHLCGGIIVRVDLSGRVSFFNEYAEQFYGYAHDQAVGRPIVGLLVPPTDDPERDSAELVRRMLANPEQFAYREAASTLADGRQAWVAWANKPLHRPDGQVEDVLCIGIDITEHKRAEDQLQALNQTLEQRVAERTAVAEHRTAQLRALASELTHVEQRERRRLAEILHDHLQQLLVAAKLNLGLLHGQVDEGGPRHVLRQVEELLNESIYTARSLTVELSPPVLYDSGLVAALRWLARQMQAKHGLRVSVDADESAAPAAEDIRVLLFQSVREALFNVVKHARTDEAHVSIERCGDRQVCVRVRDAGAGFDPAAAQQHADLAGGMGLFSIQERLSLVGGRLEVASAPGRGTTITMLAPLATEEPPQRPPLRAAPIEGVYEPVPPTETPEHVAKIRVLVVEDHPIVREGLVGLLQGEFDVEVVGQAGDGVEAVELARQLHPDVVITDISMPRMNGIEATRRIVADLPHCRVVGLSMHDDAGIAQAIRDAGATAYVTKGGPSEALLAAVRGSLPMVENHTGRG